MGTSRRMWPKTALNDAAKEVNFNEGWNVSKIYNFGEMKAGIVWHGSNGKPAAYANYIYSDFIKIKPGQRVFFCKDGGFINYYKDNNYESYVGTTQLSEFTQPDSCNYIIYCQYSENGKLKDDDVYSFENFPVNSKYSFEILQQPGMPDYIYIDRLKTALNVNNVTITVSKYPGTGNWNLDLTSNGQAASHTWTGFRIGNNVKLKFTSGVTMKAIFDNTDRWIYDNFAPFTAIGDFTMENVVIEAQNCRYCVHDELNGTGQKNFHNYINCIMKYTNTHSDINYVQCIGGGLGAETYINIDGGRYESNTTTPFSGLTIQASKQPITYHNGWPNVSGGSIWIKNVYANGHFKFGYYGTNSHKSPITISGCSTEDATVVEAENSDAKINNFDLVEFNNTIRNK